MIPSRVAAVPFASGPGASELLAWDHPGSPVYSNSDRQYCRGDQRTGEHLEVLSGERSQLPDRMSNFSPSFVIAAPVIARTGLSYGRPARR